MKKNILTAIFFAGTSLSLLNSCKKSESDTPQPVSTVTTIKNDPSLSIFAAIEALSGDDNYVNNSGAIIAPVDSAFINAGISATVAATLSPADCDSIVKYYTITSGVNFNGTANTETAFASLLGQSLYADSTGSQLYFDGVAAVSPTPVVIGKSSIYKVGQFVNPPAVSVAQITTTDTSLSLLNEALVRTNFTSNLTSGAFTLLMPTNAAFVSAGFPDIASIDSVNIATLTQILLYHTITNNLFKNDIALQSSLTTLQGGAIQLNSSGGSLQLIGNSSYASPASFLNNGELAGNVETYKINNLLLP